MKTDYIAGALLRVSGARCDWQQLWATCEMAQAVITDRALQMQVAISPYPGELALPASLYRPLPPDQAAKV